MPHKTPEERIEDLEMWQTFQQGFNEGQSQRISALEKRIKQLGLWYKLPEESQKNINK